MYDGPMSTDDVVTRDFRRDFRQDLRATTVDTPGAGQVDVDDVPLVSDLERYEELGSLGKGGMGEVRLYKDKRIARPIAIKMLRGKVKDDEEYRSRFLLEARLQGQLEHPSIVPVHDLGELPDGQLFFSMTRVKGQTLRTALSAVKKAAPSRLSRRRLLAAFSSVCLAIEFAHSRGVVHRDLKPENIMLGDYGQVYVLDWGIAKVLHRAETPLPDSIEVPEGSEASTRAGTVLGTEPYMAPEHRAGRADTRSDVYSLGVILAEILKAEPALDIPPELDMIAKRATHERAEERFATVRHLHDTVEAFLDGDRDLELRRQHAAVHTRRAEVALARGDRAEAGHEIGRALGLDPQSSHAFRTLMHLLGDVPDVLPAGAEAALDRAWVERRHATLRGAIPLGLSSLGLLPFYMVCGIRNWWLVLAMFCFTLLTAWCESRAATPGPRARTWIAASMLSIMLWQTVATTSVGLMGLVPATFALVGIAWRVLMRSWLGGAAIIGLTTLTVALPFVLSGLGVVPSMYELRDNTIIVHPVMHGFPPVATMLLVAIGTIGGTFSAVLYGRHYNQQILRAERRLTFHAWQLQQLLPAGS
jgi:tRNA A-37 threonylcarbamoyl transferase component Bud32